VYRRIRDLREDKDLTQTQVAQYLNCSQRAYSGYELGHRNIPIQILIALAKFHNTSTDYLLGLTNNPKPYE
jgi:transcriptional regulator with XRE-family HTH domain